MSDAFSFKAARPKAQPTSEQQMNEETRATALGLEPLAAKRKRRTRAEIEAAGLVRSAPAPDEMTVLKACLKQLRLLHPSAAYRLVQTMEVIFK
jgi:hypothetical protein